MLRLCVQTTARDWRAGELRFLLLALLVAVAALSSVSFFVDRMRTGLTRDAHQLLGADLVISSDGPITASWRSEAERRGLVVAETIAFPSMASVGNGEQSQAKLASVKAVSDGYPLRGNLKTTVDLGTVGVATRAVPAPGTVWVDSNLMSALQLKIGSVLQLGDLQLRVARVITSEPDRGAAFMNFAPRVMLSLDDLPATHLIQFGSRVTYRLLLAGPPQAASAYEQWVNAAIENQKLKGIRLESLDNSRPEMRATLDRAEQFLSLVGLLSSLLAAVAIAMAARRFMVRHVDACAMLRCLGLTQGAVTWIYCGEFVLIGLMGSAAGVVVGFAAHFVLLEWLGKLVASDLPPASWLPALQGLATGMVLLLGFALPPVLQLRNVPHNRVIRREQGAPQPVTLLTYLLGLAGFVALLLWQAGDLKVGAITAGGFLGGSALFAVFGWLSLRGLHRIRRVFRAASWRFATTALQRRPGATVVQIVALALGLMALLLLTIVRGDLIDAWHRATPPDAPNQFVINIQPDQTMPLAALLRGNGIPNPHLFPMVRGRLIQINAADVAARAYKDERASHLVEREFNLSTMSEVPTQNQIVAGRWFDDTRPEASVEAGLAEQLGLKIGDVLTFDIAGQRVQAPITSLRKLDWGSMQVNFYVILNPHLMAQTPQTWITAFHLPAANGTLVNRLTRDFPNLTVVDVGAVLAQVQVVIDQVVLAVEFLFLFTLASGLLVLYAALAGSQDVRTREAGLLRALGATRRQLEQAQRIEFSLIGSLAGLLAAAGATAIGWSLATWVFHFAWHFGVTVWLVGTSAGAICALVGSWFGLRRVLEQPPLQTLREA
ncbi:MAG: FtsX-like permease family protein [Pseudomonadota bacterium]|nr:FtsX-like permease family protein [Pseudomonadota bacterium]